jgi:hypothetical protein
MEMQMNRANAALAVGEGRYGVLLVARVAMALVLAVAVWLGMMVAATTAGRLVLELGQWAGMFVLEVLGAGIRMSLLAGPHALAHLTSVWPSFHLGQVAQYAMGSDGVDLLPHGLSLVGIAVLFVVFVRRGLRKVS